MIIVVSSPAPSHSTDPTAAAVSAALRPASFQAASRTEKALAIGSQLDVDRLYPNLSAAKQSVRPMGAIASALAALRHAAPLR